MLQLSTEFQLTLTAHATSTARFFCNSFLLVLIAPHKSIVSPLNTPFQIKSFVIISTTKELDRQKLNHKLNLARFVFFTLYLILP